MGLGIRLSSGHAGNCGDCNVNFLSQCLRIRTVREKDSLKEDRARWQNTRVWALGLSSGNAGNCGDCSVTVASLTEIPCRSVYVQGQYERTAFGPHDHMNRARWQNTRV